MTKTIVKNIPSNKSGTTTNYRNSRTGKFVPSTPSTVEKGVIVSERPPLKKTK
jgi:hypothetical protein